MNAPLLLVALCFAVAGEVAAEELPLPTAPPLPAPAPPSRPPPAPPQPSKGRAPPYGRFAISTDVVGATRTTIGTLPWGFGLSLGAAIDLGPVTLVPRAGLHLAPSRFDGFGFGGALDFGALWSPSFGPLTLLLGGGAGLRLASLRGPDSSASAGTVIVATTTSHQEATELGYGGYLRAGVQFFRQTRASLTLWADFQISSYATLGVLYGPAFSLGLFL